MILRIKSSENRPLGTLEVLGGVVDYKEGFDGVLKIFVNDSIEKGITLQVSAYNESTREFVNLKKSIHSDDVLFALALRDFLRNSDFMVEEVRPETDSEILSIISQLPEGDVDRVELTQKLDEISYLQKTTLLRDLKEVSKNNTT
jgi:hypothetical protein